ncbi:segregation/condensation protein A [Desertibacillus haloalkaliphilus]|uniref:segregation/condensation protein A n=1 Tax=Desertibacillus haloalkaliphilus TaxID=1328930 RepID=UPI001C25ABE8|nr:segregation/condensation protein A [Desertibacillus haloalkaliphilus]MBU8907882.1 segregation/condensation protein A [Desertibacillus haloalkaliphilus]
MNQYNVKLEAFEGPLDLLLHLINQAEVDIYDIPVSKITDQYLEYIHTMQELELDIASEFLVMAATLLAIKSKMLLPKQEEELLEDDMYLEEDEDPRQELMDRLIEYRKYKEAAKDLEEREKERALVHTKPPSDLSPYTEDAPIAQPSSDVSIYQMLEAYQKLMNRNKIRKPKLTTVKAEEISLEARMDEIIDELGRHHGKKNFYELFPYQDRPHIVVTFLALLELMKSNLIFCEQVGNFTDIMVYQSEGVFVR